MNLIISMTIEGGREGEGYMVLILEAVMEVHYKSLKTRGKFNNIYS